MTKAENKQNVYEWLKGKKLGLAIIAGIMANIEAESDYRSNLAEKARRGGMTSEEYTAAVDSGEYKDFVTDHIGYGLCQWTYHTRKQALVDMFEKSRQKKPYLSISSYGLQLKLMLAELKANKELWEKLSALNNNEVGASVAGYIICMDFERPAAKITSSVKRAEKAVEIFREYSKEQKNEQRTACYISTLSSNRDNLIVCNLYQSIKRQKRIIGG